MLLDSLSRWFLCLLSCFSPGLLAQSSNALVSVSATDNFSASSPLFTGLVYRMPRSNISGHPWVDQRWKPGKVNWLGQPFQCDRLRYDLVEDQLVVHPDTHRAEVLLLSQLQVAHFQMGEKFFTQLPLERKVTAPAPLQQGYYEQVYRDKELELMIKRLKYVTTQNRTNEINQSFWFRSFTYLFQDGVYHRIRSKRNLLNCLRDQKKAMRRYFRQQNILFKRASSADLAKVLAYYSSLQPEE